MFGTKNAIFLKNFFELLHVYVWLMMVLLASGIFIFVSEVLCHKFTQFSVNFPK